MSLHGCPLVASYHRGRAHGLAFAQHLPLWIEAHVKKRKCGPQDEVALFRGMKDALVRSAATPGVAAEEYHGFGHQVRFGGHKTFTRGAKARCELSDLAVLVYDRHRQEARLTYIQAKSERVVPAQAGGVSGCALEANLEQWDLLDRRPSIKGVNPFQPPDDLLLSAQHDSVGSFVFFLKGPQGIVIYYAAASLLAPVPSTRRDPRYGKLVATGDVWSCSPMPECLSVYGNAEFGAFLFGLAIGTPVLPPGRLPRRSATWLAAQLRGFATKAREKMRNSDLASELATLLDADGAPPAARPDVGARSLVILGLDSPEERQRG